MTGKLRSVVGIALTTLLAATLTTGPFSAARAEPAPGDPQTLWFDEAATDWQSRALPIGSGGLGAMVFGGTTAEHLQLNEKTLWTGGPGSVQGYDFGNWRSPRPTALADARAQIQRNGSMSDTELSSKLGQSKRGFGSYQTLGDLWLDMPGSSGATGYKRYLNLGDATAGVTYTAGGAKHSREYLASNPAGVIAGKVSADQTGKVSFTLRVSSPRADQTVSVSNGRLTVRGALADNGMRFESQIRVLTTGGTRTDGADRITVTGADSAVFLFAAGTNYSDVYPTYRGADPHTAVTSRVDSAAAKGFDAIRAEHVADHKALYDRVKLDIGQVMPTKTTDDLRSAYTGGTSPADRALEALYFNYGRYLLIASSRGGSLPANLQGVWNNSTAPPWDADYHVNINMQMNYWLADTTNLGETVEPFTRYVEAMRAPGERTATEMFGTGGWLVHNQTNPFGFTGVHTYPSSFWFPEAGAWLTRHLFDHYEFTGDTAYLRNRAYPLMKGAAQFWLANLKTDPRDGKLVVTPSHSPEHGNVSAGAASAEQIVHDLFGNTIEAIDALGVDATFRAQLVTARANLDPGTRVGRWGQLQEWKTDWDSQSDQHRHLSHLYGLFPGDQIQANTAYGNASKVTLNARGDGGPGWSPAWKVNLWARLRDGGRAQQVLAGLLRNSTFANLLNNGPPFQIEANFGATSGFAEMLLQSQTSVIDVLPALPATWPTGSVAGLRARGNVTVDTTWANRTARKITLTAGSGRTLKVRNTMFTSQFTLTDVTTGSPVTTTRVGDTITFAAQAGHRYEATAQGGPTVRVATQSSTYSHSLNPSADKAIDGNTSGAFSGGSVTHTNTESQPWWQVDLGASQQINQLAVWNRTDCCSSRLSNYYVLVSDTPFTGTLSQILAQPGVWSAPQTGQAGSPTTIPVGRTGRYVRVQLQSTSEALSLAEVVVNPTG
ncbi:MAG TPA: glycoside hydrolase N-terminal domain-containing protein [Actinokineospora sp.]|nr:glycoside hydrolase N-terminal domain-containing protein [Actinokineospora sp.]